jgi:hypothetical protein
MAHARSRTEEFATAGDNGGCEDVRGKGEMCSASLPARIEKQCAEIHLLHNTSKKSTRKSFFAARAIFEYLKPKTGRQIAPLGLWCDPLSPAPGFQGSAITSPC